MKIFYNLKPRMITYTPDRWQSKTLNNRHTLLKDITSMGFDRELLPIGISISNGFCLVLLYCCSIYDFLLSGMT